METYNVRYYKMVRTKVEATLDVQADDISQAIAKAKLRLKGSSFSPEITGHLNIDEGIWMLESVTNEEMRLKHNIGIDLFDVYKNIGIDRPANHDAIVDFIHDDLIETLTTPEDYSTGDVAIGFRRFIETSCS